MAALDDSEQLNLAAAREEATAVDAPSRLQFLTQQNLKTKTNQIKDPREKYWHPNPIQWHAKSIALSQDHISAF